jgi:archaetidylinositol phosphate synthase
MPGHHNLEPRPPVFVDKSMPAGFQEAKREQQSFLAPLEKRCLIWLAERAPRWINSDHLTLLGLAALLGAGLSFWWARSDPAGLYAVIVCLALNWLGDSLDGTLARVRNCQRPRYGFYVDHVVDAFGALFLLGGLALSGFMSERIALGLLIAYLMLSIEVYLATYALGTFHISFWKFSPTELRILLAVGSTVLMWHPDAHLKGTDWRLFDIGGAAGMAGMGAMLVVAVAKHTRTLYNAERIG